MFVGWSLGLLDEMAICSIRNVLQPPTHRPGEHVDLTIHSGQMATGGLFCATLAQEYAPNCVIAKDLAQSALHLRKSFYRRSK